MSFMDKTPPFEALLRVRLESIRLISVKYPATNPPSWVAELLFIDELSIVRNCENSFGLYKNPPLVALLLNIYDPIIFT